MSARTRELAERRAILRLRSAMQRRAIAREFGAAEARLQSVDRVLAVGSSVLRHPAVIAAGLLAFVLLGRARAFRLLGHAALLTSGVRSLLRSTRARL